MSLYRRLTAGDDKHWALVPVRSTVRWLVFFYQSLKRDHAFIRAAAMTYMTLVAMVPTLMLVFGILHAVGMFSDTGGSDLLSGPLGSFFSNTLLGGIPEFRDFLLPGLMQVDLGAMGKIGVAVLAVISARLFMLVESAYNEIFGVTIDRSLGYRILNFYFTMTMLPLIGLVAVLGTEELGIQSVWFADWLQRALTFALLLMALKAFPCTKVRWDAAIAGATVSWIGLQIAGMALPFYLSRVIADKPVMAVYGALGLAPVFLLWVYLLWIVVLLGVEVAYVTQNFTSLVAAEDDAFERSHSILRQPSIETAIETAVKVAWAFDRGRGPIDVEILAKTCQVPARELNVVLAVLEEGGILVKADDGGWMPSRPAASIPVAEVIDSWRELTTLRKTASDPIGDAVADALKELLSGTLADGLNDWVPKGDTEMLPMPVPVPDPARVPDEVDDAVG